MDYQYLDMEGLQELVNKIKSIYATKETTDSLRTDLTTEVARAMGVEGEISQTLSNEIQRVIGLLNEETNRATLAEQTETNRATNEESRIETLLNQEVTDRQTAISTETSERESSDNVLDARVTVLENTIPVSGKVNNVTVDGTSVLDTTDLIAKIKSEDIKVLTQIETIEGITGEVNKLYKTTSDNKIYQWTGSEFKEIGKDFVGKEYIVLVDALPEVGQQRDVLYIVNSTNKIHQWTGSIWQEIGGTDSQLREEFEAHLTSEYAHASLFNAKANEADLETHTNDKDNPHEVTKLQIGLGNVDNTADSDKPVSAATQTALNDKVDLSTYTAEVGLKVNYTDIKDNLETVDPAVPLSANQGAVLNSKITELNSKILSFGSALVFKGVVPSKEYLDTVITPTGPIAGDCYQINTEINSNDEEDLNGAMFAWKDGSPGEWIKIVAAATDLTSMLATNAEINKIISDYE